MDMKIGTKACAIPNKSGGLRASRAQLPLVPGFVLWCQATASSGARLLCRSCSPTMPRMVLFDVNLSQSQRRKENVLSLTPVSCFFVARCRLLPVSMHARL